MAKKKAMKRSTRRRAAKKASKKPPKKTIAKKSSKKISRRELIDTGVDKRFVRRDAEGQFEGSDDVGLSLAADRRRRAKKKSKSGQGDKGDRAVTARLRRSAETSS